MIPKSVQCHVRVAAGRELHARLRGRKRSHFEAIGTAMFTLNCYKQTISNDVLRFLSPFTQVFRDIDETSKEEKYREPNFFSYPESRRTMWKWYLDG